MTKEQKETQIKSFKHWMKYSLFFNDEDIDNLEPFILTIFYQRFFEWQQNNIHPQIEPCHSEYK